MDIADLQTNWNELGRTDPLWAILSAPDKVNRQWDLQQFFSTGVVEISGVMQYLDSLGLKPARRRALDFGCGVGRLTQAMCRHFESCAGIDIAQSMIDLAAKYNQYPERCTWHLNSTDSLETFGDNTWDFIYSNLVLQHMKPEYTKHYVREFLRILSPDGVLLFQLPAEVNGKPPIVPNADRLPDEGFRALISTADSTFTAPPGRVIQVTLGVTNLSPATWPSSTRIPQCPIGVGNHWLSENGELLVRDDARAGLASDLSPGEQIELSLFVRAPHDPGKYILEFDMVQEFVAWFGDKGSAVSRVPVVILPEVEAPFANQPQPPSQPRIEMYGVPKQEILDTVAAAGGRIIDIQEDLAAGAEWTSFRYCVMKSR